jgi:hypothetical protein
MAIDPNFIRSPKAEARALARGNVTAEEIEARGGINASGYYGDSYGINSADKVSLSDAEYKAASMSGIGGVTGAGGAAVNKALAEKIKAQTGKYPSWWASAQAAAASNNVPGYTAPAIVNTPTSTTVTTPTLKTVGTFTDPKSGDIYALRDDGSKELLSKGTKEADTLTAKEAADAKAKADAYSAKMVADAKTQEIKEKRESAYETLKTEFTKYGLGDDKFLSQVKNLILTGTPTSEATLKLRGTAEYAERFAGNQERLNSGKNVYDEATYLSLENQYRETFGAYGLR